AGSESGEGDPVVVLPMGRDADDINVRILEKLAVVCVAGRDFEFSLGESESLGIAIGEGDKLTAGQRLDGAGMNSAKPADTDDSPSYWFHMVQYFVFLRV